jgi:hypothetical protein
MPEIYRRKCCGCIANCRYGGQVDRIMKVPSGVRNQDTALAGTLLSKTDINETARIEQCASTSRAAAASRPKTCGTWARSKIITDMERVSDQCVDI